MKINHDKICFFGIRLDFVNNNINLKFQCSIV